MLVSNELKFNNHLLRSLLMAVSTPFQSEFIGVCPSTFASGSLSLNLVQFINVLCPIIAMCPKTLSKLVHP